MDSPTNGSQGRMLKTITGLS